MKVTVHFVDGTKDFWFADGADSDVLVRTQVPVIQITSTDRKIIIPISQIQMVMIEK